MKNYLYLNGKKVTKSDLVCIVNTISYMAYRVDDYPYLEFVEKLARRIGVMSDKWLASAFAFYYGTPSLDIRSRMDEDLASYFCALN